MAVTGASGASPVTFISEDSDPGKQYQIPLSMLNIGSDGTIDAGAWPSYSALGQKDTALVKTLLDSLVSRGLLTAPAS
jgi:hypothetical protein